MDVKVKPGGGRMRIGELADRSGVAPRLLRYYEEQGLLRPARTRGGYRDYTDGDVDTVRHVRTLLAAGLSTSTIGQVLPCMTADGPRLVADCPELLVSLLRERDRLSAAMDDLAATRATLDDVIGTAPSASVNRAADLREGRATAAC